MLIHCDIGESIIIGDGANQVIMTLECNSDNKIGLSIDAPKHMPVYLEDIYNRLHQEEYDKEFSYDSYTTFRNY